MKLPNTTAELDALLDSPLERVKVIHRVGFTNIDLSFLRSVGRIPYICGRDGRIRSRN